MQNDFLSHYLAKLEERVKKSRVRTEHQHAGLVISAILNDSQHKSLYMKLAKLYNSSELIALAKNIADRKNVKNRGAYFMRIITERIKEEGPKRFKANEDTNNKQQGRRNLSPNSSERNAARSRDAQKTSHPRKRDAGSND